jgi:hypothetical protein
LAKIETWQNSPHGNIHVRTAVGIDVAKPDGRVKKEINNGESQV